MVDTVNAQGGKAYLIIGYDTRKFMADSLLIANAVMTSQQRMQARDKYIDYQHNLASSIKGATIVPEFNLNPSYVSDGIHPDADQQKYIAQVLLQGL